MVRLNRVLTTNFWKEESLGFKKKKRLILLASLPIPIILGLILYVIGAASTTIIAVIALSLIMVVLPYVAFGFFEFRELKLAEEKFPDFLRDLSQAVSAGMTIPQAVDISAKTDYGGLTPYVKKLHIWLSWSTPFPTAWMQFTKLLKRSALIRRINAIILEAFYSGGDIRATLSSLAEDVELLKQMDADKKSLLRQQIIIMYVVYFIFIGVLLGLYKILAPVLYIQQIGVFSGLSLSAGTEPLTLDYFKNLFFIMALVEAVCAGMIAGQIAEEKAIAGLKHVVIMLAVSIFLFFVLVFPATLSLEASVYPSSVNPLDPINIRGQVFYESAPATNANVEIIGPNGEVKSVFADNVGEYQLTLDAPSQPGMYAISISARHQDETKVVQRTIKVGT